MMALAPLFLSNCHFGSNLSLSPVIWLIRDCELFSCCTQVEMPPRRTRRGLGEVGGIFLWDTEDSEEQDVLMTRLD